MTPITSLSKTGMENGTPPKVAHGNARLPDGRKVDDVKPGSLFRIPAAAGVQGVSAEMGKSALAEAYARHCTEIYDAAGRAALDAWREQCRPKATPGEQL